jgi:hypothetical protein
MEAGSIPTLIHQPIADAHETHSHSQNADVANRQVRAPLDGDACVTSAPSGPGRGHMAQPPGVKLATLTFQTFRQRSPWRRFPHGMALDFSSEKVPDTFSH